MKEIIVALAAFFSSLSAIITGNSFGHKTATNPPPAAIIEKAQTPTAFLSLKSDSKNFDAGKDVDIDVYLKTSKVNLASGSVRLVYAFENKPLIKFKDYQEDKKGVQIKINPLLVSQDFLFPVNTVETDTKNKHTYIDLAFLTVNPKGYEVGEDLYLGTLTFQGLTSKSTIRFDFDAEMTTLQNKKGEEIPLDLKNESYIIN